MGSEYKYGCAMLYFDFPQLSTLHGVIKEEDIFRESVDGEVYGLEVNPHVTLLYGLHVEVVPDDVWRILKDINFTDIELSNISAFNTGDYDVLKFDAFGEQLYTANNLLRENFPYTNDFPNYQPHATIGYLNKDMAKPYIGALKDSRYKVKPKSVVITSPTYGTCQYHL